MSDLVSPRLPAIAVRAARPSRPLPTGVGLAIGAAISLGLWGAIIAALVRAWR